MSSTPFWTALGLGTWMIMAGCGPSGPLVISPKQPEYAPWCGPHQRVKVGERVVGYVNEGPKHKSFLVDDAGREHDPEKIAQRVWAYLERTGDARKIKDAFVSQGRVTTMPVVSLNPLVVMLETYMEPSWQNQNRDCGHNDWYWTAQIQPNSNPRHSASEVRWCSPELKQGPTKLTFSEDGVAEIRLPSGKIRLIRNGAMCRTERE